MRRKRILCFGAPGNLCGAPNIKEYAQRFISQPYITISLSLMACLWRGAVGKVWFFAERQVCLRERKTKTLVEAIIKHFQIRPVCFFFRVVPLLCHNEANIQCCSYSPVTFHENKQDGNAIKLICII